MYFNLNGGLVESMVHEQFCVECTPDPKKPRDGGSTVV